MRRAKYTPRVKCFRDGVCRPIRVHGNEKHNSYRQTQAFGSSYAFECIDG